MKKILFCLLLLPSLAFSQQSFNMTLLSNYDDPNLPARSGLNYNDCWGYHASNGTEVAIIGGSEDILFINITSPANPVLILQYHVTNLDGSTNQSIWRDFKTYQNYAYAAADEGDSGLLIFDLSQVPSSITMVKQTNAFWNRTHNIFIDEANGRLYAAGSNTQSNGLKILNLTTNPSNPSQIGAIALNTLGGGYVHDVYVRNNIAYCSHGSLSKLQMYDMNDLSNISLVGVIANYPEAGYNHSSWLNPAGNMVVMADETHGSDLKLVDISDPLNISSDDIHTFYSELDPSAPGDPIAHNPFIMGDLAYISYYHDGVQVFNISDPQNIQIEAYYDTYPQNTNYNGYDGCWGVYPFLPSGNIIASDINNGLFVMQITSMFLGIDFLSFIARRQTEDVKLFWTVSDVADGNTFQITRSSNGGKSYNIIGTVPYVDQQSQYNFVDQNVSLNEKFMYRINFVQLDGKLIYSPVRSISAENSDSNIRVVNPMSSVLTLDVMNPIESLDIKIFDMSGRLTWSHKETAPKARMEIPVKTLIPGQYVLALNWNGGSDNKLIQVIQ